MRTVQKAVLAVAIATQIVLGSSCTSPVPATVTKTPTTPLKVNPAVFLQAAVERPRIADSLRDAGVRVAETYAEVDYILNVDVGRRRRPQTCGGRSNIAYYLDARDGHVMVIKGVGLTGTCAPNVFDDMS